MSIKSISSIAASMSLLNAVFWDLPSLTYSLKPFKGFVSGFKSLVLSSSSLVSWSLLRSSSERGFVPVPKAVLGSVESTTDSSSCNWNSNSTCAATAAATSFKPSVGGLILTLDFDKSSTRIRLVAGKLSSSSLNSNSLKSPAAIATLFLSICSVTRSILAMNFSIVTPCLNSSLNFLE